MGRENIKTNLDSPEEFFDDPKDGGTADIESLPDVILTERVHDKFPDDPENDVLIVDHEENAREYGEATFIPDDFDADNVLELSTESKRFQRLKEEIEDADSIDALCGILRQTDIIQGDRQTFRSSDVINLIQEADDFLSSNIDKIIAGVINKGGDQFRDLLGSKVNKITRGGDLGIRSKVRELMKEQMAVIFEKNRNELVKKAVFESQSFDQLYGVISQFKDVNDGSGDRIAPSVIIQRIKLVVRGMDSFIDKSAWLNDDGAVNTEINYLMGMHHIPSDSGIDSKVSQLLIEYVRNAREEKKDNGQVKGGIGSRIKKSFFKLIGR